MIQTAGSHLWFDIMCEVVNYQGLDVPYEQSYDS